MATTSRLGTQIAEILTALDRAGTAAALIGGLALAPHGVVRAAQDVDLLTDATMGEKLHKELLALGYQCIHSSADAANYQRNDERVDLLFASRPTARKLLAEARPRSTPFGSLRVISLEGLIAFNSMNSSPKSPDSGAAAPARDVLVGEGGIRGDSKPARDAFEALDDLMTVVEALCPRWPSREPCGPMRDLRL
ncbi:MAG: hypothetical protein BroJett010_14080 [Gammaproteobacteria bacterium]|jgi:hypothetical protein|nr:MAG: hypothetical protein B6D47_02745 [Rhodocyclaceae bacterium UTPRO2]GIK34849.1 MAG: hypothetical protein BroJett010_14080 [Gammaproteobacteria bacterium]